MADTFGTLWGKWIEHHPDKEDVRGLGFVLLHLWRSYVMEGIRFGDESCSVVLSQVLLAFKVWKLGFCVRELVLTKYF